MNFSSYDYIGYIATLIGMSAYLVKSPKNSLKIYAIAEIIWILYFVFLNSLSAILVSAKTIFRSLAGAYLSDLSMRIITLSILASAVVYFVSTSLAWYQFMPLLAAFFDTIAIWLRNSFLNFRIMMICSETCWIVFGLYASAMPNIVCAILTIGIILFSYLQYRKTLNVTP